MAQPALVREVLVPTDVSSGLAKLTCNNWPQPNPCYQTSKAGRFDLCTTRHPTSTLRAAMKTQGSTAVENAAPNSAVERFRATIFRYILRLVGNRAQAEDLLQETLLRAHQRMAELRDPGALESWLYRIATNVSYDALRHGQRQPRFDALSRGDDGTEQEPSIPDEASLRPDQLLEQHGMSDCVGRFIADLPDAERSVLLLHDLQGYTDSEIADQLQISLPNAKVRLHRARSRLKIALTASCELSHDDRGIFVCDPKPACH
jgi:RNA polymerase sigma-70 factor (ECF subfamily)